MTSELEKTQNRIDHYVDSIRAIVGFINFYRYDNEGKRMRESVKFYQGIRLRQKGESDSTDSVTPDIGIIEDNTNAVLGEVKITFPRDKDRWWKDFEQLLGYDREFVNWPLEGGLVRSHEIALLVHQSRTREVLRYFGEKEQAGEIKFARPFIVIEFSRSDNREVFFFFRIEYGKLSNQIVNDALERGVMVPMKALTKQYSTVKLYDAEPPVPYLAHLIWDHVVNSRAKENPKYPKLHWNQKISIKVDVEEIVDTLYDAFSIRSIQDFDAPTQPKVPQTEWVKRACDYMTEIGDAKWMGRDEIEFYFKPFKDTKDHFLKNYHEGSEDVEQMEIFTSKQHGG